MEWVVVKQKPWHDPWYRWRWESPEFYHIYSSFANARTAIRNRRDDGARCWPMPYAIARLARRDGRWKVSHMGKQVTWTPREFDLWSYADAHCNEFSTATDRGPLTEAEFEDYFEWSHHEVSGVVDHVDDDFVYVRLDQPTLLDGVPHDMVAYPAETLDVVWGGA